jgi:hypothetical protein
MWMRVRIFRCDVAATLHATQKQPAGHRDSLYQLPKQARHHVLTDDVFPIHVTPTPKGNHGNGAWHLPSSTTSTAFWIIALACRPESKPRGSHPRPVNAMLRNTPTGGQNKTKQQHAVQLAALCLGVACTSADSGKRDKHTHTPSLTQVSSLKSDTSANFSNQEGIRPNN